VIPRVSAAEHYLGVYYYRVINTVDMLWLNRHAEQWRTQHRVHHERQVSTGQENDRSMFAQGRISQVMRRRRAKAA
jgi:fatty acid desaturase